MSEVPLYTEQRFGRIGGRNAAHHVRFVPRNGYTHLYIQHIKAYTCIIYPVIHTGFIHFYIQLIKAYTCIIYTLIYTAFIHLYTANKGPVHVQTASPGLQGRLLSCTLTGPGGGTPRTSSDLYKEIVFNMYIYAVCIGKATYNTCIGPLYAVLINRVPRFACRACHGAAL